MNRGRGLILAGDIGGTNARLAVLCEQEGKFTILRRDGFSSRDYPGLVEAVKAFLAKGNETISFAGFGMPGPVLRGQARITLLPWAIDAGELTDVLGTNKVWVLNDLKAAGYGVEGLGAKDFYELNLGEPIAGNRALIAAGTGLGQCLMFWSGGRYFSSASEGGHADFAPENELEMALADFLKDEFGHVSWERVLSGPGIHNIYKFLRARARAPEPKDLAQRMEDEDPARCIVERALRGEDGVCEKTLDLFVSFYGREAGNLALKALAVGGLYIGGGIARKILGFMERGAFMDAFTSKGRMSWLLKHIPVRVIVSDDVGLFGAARYASEQMNS